MLYIQMLCIICLLLLMTLNVILAFSFSFATSIVRNQNYSSQHNRHHGTSLRAVTSDFQSTSYNLIGTTNIAPIYITIGPPCSGKTEALRSVLLSDGYDPDVVFTQDIAISEQSEAYHRVPIAAFLFPDTKLSPKMGNQILRSGSTLKERLSDPSFDATDQEIRAVVLRIAGRLTPNEFMKRVRKLAQEAGDTVHFFKTRRKAVVEDLILATEQVHFQAVAEVICQEHFQVPIQNEDVKYDELPFEKKTSNQSFNKDKNAELNVDYNSTLLLSARDLIKTPHVDIFVPQAIFRGGIDRANEAFENLLQKTPLDQPISWGNTNTRPSEYSRALKSAEKAGRPVKFIAWGYRLEEVSRQELLRRNVAQFRSTGRYIPCGALAASLGRVEKLIKEARIEADRISNIDSLTVSDDWINQLVDSALATLAGFRMEDGGFVVQTGDPKF